jgi:hypothetical protein
MEVVITLFMPAIGDHQEKTNITQDNSGNTNQIKAFLTFE